MGKTNPFPVIASWLLLVSLLAGLILGGCSRPRDDENSGKEVERMPEEQQQLVAPPMDREVPEHVETATFALG